MQTQVPNSDERQQQQHDTHSTTNASTSNSVNWPFLQDYPDVESNVNRKFRSWEIAVSDELIVENNSATPPRIPSRYLRGDRFCESNVLKTSDKSQDSQSVKVLVIDQSIPCLGTQSILGTGDKTTKSSITSKTFIHSESTPLPSHVESTIAPPYPDSPVPKQKILQDRSLPINLAVNRNGGRYLTTEAAGTSERYYFTNGEKDPWIELTLAGTSAQEYLRAQRERDLHRHSRQPQEDEQIPEPRHTFNCGNPGSEHGCQSKDGEYTSKPPPKGPMEKQHRRKHYSGRQENMDPLKPPPVTHSPTSRRPQHSTLRDQPLGWPSHDAREGKDTHIQDQDRLDDTKQFKKRGFDPVNEFETVMRIIPSASHCQDILYESSDLDSNELRAERQHVIKTFVRWIELDKQLDLERGG
ncbi:hypothetical protein BGW38_000375 [Lunasporangiospora selenospora]|uniref:Uncharacterized protein n=1 Tax=Lunasporangiospora selenospora TaxID=979761 RepID=A0A9P6G352_9FUNG|nr:hypothetical protein BGW38_000375 [Lunasporangiospora selenospora]